MHPQGSEYAKKNGWWDFPYDYDPVWMTTNCSDFTPKKDSTIPTNERSIVKESIAGDQ